MNPVTEDMWMGQLVFSASLGRNGRPFTLILLDLKSGSQQMPADYRNGNDAVAPAWSPTVALFCHREIRAYIGG